MNSKLSPALFIIIFLAILSACQKYQVTLNERPIYTPPELLEGLATADPALEACIQQTILDGNIVKLEGLTRLRCTHAGIRSLTGLEQLAWLQELDLSNNELSNIDKLFKLERLTHVRLVENAGLDCDQLKALKAARKNIILEGPNQCG